MKDDLVGKEEGKKKKVQWKKKRKRSGADQISSKRSAPKGISLPLHSAARSGEVGHITELLTEASARGAHIVDARDEHGRTPLHLAAYSGHSNVLCALLENGANVHAGAMDNMTALHFASQSGSLECVRKLLEAGADKDAVMTNNRRTPLHIALLRSRCDIIDTLIEAGANIDAADSKSITPRSSQLVLDILARRQSEQEQLRKNSSDNKQNHNVIIDTDPLLSS
uniref:Uncharacterized protein n=1 Tax=Aureoumbra lagunensis TaxID=44058 RepID=A0A7S3JUZ6_9STRA|mmetsp:Transcript_16540/g.24842  ORF Transcript_16540/g.24842 Transcript_16540/m.24842 type:complete len:225 (+) Transcript_16540:33-707(+)